MYRENNYYRLKLAYQSRLKSSQAKKPQRTPKHQQVLETRPSTQKSEVSLSALNKYHFNFIHPVGKGGFGRVWKVELKRTKEQFAMKEMQKLRILSKRSIHSVMNERKLLSFLKHPFLVNMHYAFQDRENLYLVMDLLSGGDLRYHLGKAKRFTESQTQFFVACIVQGLEYIHLNAVIHRDIKPENLVIDSEGYIKITDFGVARQWTPENAKDTSGTPGYMAPEVMCRQNHGIAVDYFALGVIAYECMLGRRPYIGRNRKEIRDAILSKQVQVRLEEVPEGWSMEAVDFINSLIQRKVSRRLGTPTEVKNHPWLRNFNWEKLSSRTLESPYIPPLTDNFDSRVNSEWNDELDPNLLHSSVQGLFAGYYYDTRSNFSSLQDTQKNPVFSRRVSYAKYK